MDGNLQSIIDEARKAYRGLYHNGRVCVPGTPFGYWYYREDAEGFLRKVNVDGEAVLCRLVPEVPSVVILGAITHEENFVPPEMQDVNSI